jgi:hypothetical protein
VKPTTSEVSRFDQHVRLSACTMSDNDDDNFMDGDEDEYDLEYSETSNSEPDVDLENQVRAYCSSR